MGINYGSLIKTMRKKAGVSQDNLADTLNCTPTHVSRIENNKTGLSEDKFTGLSELLNANFFKLDRYSKKFKTYSDYVAYFELDKAIISCDVEKIKKVIEDYNICENFNCDEPEIFKFYALAAINASSDIDLSMEYALKGLKISDFSFENVEKILDNALIEDSTLAILSVISKNLLSYGRDNEALKLSKILYDYYNETPFNTENFYINQTFFLKRQYIISINNYAHMNFVFGNYEYSLELCTQAIDKCVEYNILNFLLLLYELKMENYYLLDDFSNAKECYFMLKAHCITNNKEDYFMEATNLFKEKYPKIFE